MEHPLHSDPGDWPTPITGHRVLPHTADVRIQAWAPTSAECIAEAVRAMVKGFADLSRVGDCTVRTIRIDAGPPEDQLVTALNEVIYQLDTTARIPCSIEAHEDQTGLWLRLGMTDARTLPQIGAIPKAVALHDLQFRCGPGGWTCTVTLDV